MAQLLENFRTFLAADASIQAFVGGSTEVASARIFNNHVPDETGDKNFIWYRLNSQSRQKLLSGAYAGPVETGIDLECVTLNAEDADDLASAVKRRLETILPGSTLGDQVVLDAEWDAQGDDYIPKNARDGGFHVPSLLVTIFHNT